MPVLMCPLQTAYAPRRAFRRLRVADVILRSGQRGCLAGYP